jgi:excisionase family DNA binding protein
MTSSSERRFDQKSDRDTKPTINNDKKFDRLKFNGLLAYSVDEFCHLIGLGRTSFYSLRKTGQIRTISLGNRCLVPASEVDRILNSFGTSTVETQELSTK